MSDKFFFKGRQDARQNHCNAGYQTNAERKPGSRKNPLKLVVISEERKNEVQVQLDNAGVFADIYLDTTDGAVENIRALNIVLEERVSVVREKTPSRNDPCFCGSGKKYKKCCG